MIRFLKLPDAGKRMDGLRRAAAASATTYVLAVEMLAQFTLAQNVEKWQDLMQPTKAQQPTRGTEVAAETRKTFGHCWTR